MPKKTNRSTASLNPTQERKTNLKKKTVNSTGFLELCFLKIKTKNIKITIAKIIIITPLSL
jgi:hypothetical protein